MHVVRDGEDAAEGPDVAELWTRFKSSADPDARERLILHYAPLVKYVAGRIRSGLPPQVEQADLVSDGVIGLMDAIDKFQPDRGLQFQTYAVTRIRGAIIDGLRAADWVPRSVRERLRQVATAETALEAELGRTPEDVEVAQAVGISVRELHKLSKDARNSHLLSLEASTGMAEGAPEHETSFPGEDDYPPEFLQAVHELPERDRVVIALYYWERLTLAEIGEVLGITESRVSQLHKRLAMTLRGRLLRVSA